MCVPHTYICMWSSQISHSVRIICMNISLIDIQNSILNFKLEFKFRLKNVSNVRECAMNTRYYCLTVRKVP